jgi:hypothetical protein
MTYTKPEVTLLGNASELIESLANKASTDTDGGINNVPAYDLDE